LAGVAGGLTIAAAPAALTAMGFTAAGVAAGSVAAATQFAVYGGYVAPGSALALARRGGWNRHERCCRSLLSRCRRNVLCEDSLPVDVLWGSFVTHSFLPHGVEMNA